MRKLFTILAAVLLTATVWAQSPQKMSYQAVIRNSSNALVISTQIGMEINIRQGSQTGTIVYTETQTPTTNANGLVSIEIGGGANFNTINWASNNYYIETKTAVIAPLTTYTITGVSQLLSVPYALNAKTAESITGTITETDPIYTGSQAANITAAYITKLSNLSGTNTGDQDLSGLATTTSVTTALNLKVDKVAGKGLSTNDYTTAEKTKLTAITGTNTGDQALSISNDIIYLSNGGFVKLPVYGNPGSGLSSVVTVSVTDLSYANASVNANITSNGNEFILTRGVCLSKNPAPDLNDTVYVSGNGSGIFTTNCNQLAPNTTYYVRSFATNSVGTVYGNELSFTTNALTVPAIATQTVSNVTNTTAISGGNITDDGGTPILVRGLCWSLSANPTTADNFLTEGVGAGNYIALMTGLTSNTLYYVRAYAINAQGTSYGNEFSFTTIVLQLASVTTSAASSVSYTTATGGGNVTSDNGSSVTSRGICWATTTLPTTTNSNFTQAGGLGSFTANMTGLIANTTYYVRAFAINGGGTSYGNQVSFTTLTPSVASLTTKAISGVSSNLAGSGGVITTDGGSAITAKGVCWSLNTAPTTANSKTTDGTGSASYNSTMTGLNSLTLYYVRAYATNGLGTTYGNEISFTTTDLVNPGPTVPVVGTSVSGITGSSTASSGGYVSSDGGSAVTVRGVCWSTTANPTLANNFSIDGGTGMGYFSSVITGLSGCATVYYIRAYATNSTGTGYGNQNSVSTGLMSTLTTDEVTSISYYTAVSGGSVTDDGGCPITQKGVCWSYNPNPTTGNSKTTEGAGSAAFVSNITGLYANRTYYVRAYTTNIVGTTYGPEKVFTTATPSTPYIGQNYAGGIIFYLDGSGLHGLVCASADQGNYVWGCEGTSISTGTALGTGAANTAAILASCSEANIAAKICDDLVLNSYSDWFLPSKDELFLMYTNLYTQGLGNLTSPYFSSTENGINGTWSTYPGYGMGDWFNKSYQVSVRAVRAF